VILKIPEEKVYECERQTKRERERECLWVCVFFWIRLAKGRGQWLVFWILLITLRFHKRRTFLPQTASFSRRIMLNAVRKCMSIIRIWFMIVQSTKWPEHEANCPTHLVPRYWNFIKTVANIYIVKAPLNTLLANVVTPSIMPTVGQLLTGLNLSKKEKADRPDVSFSPTAKLRWGWLVHCQILHLVHLVGPLWSVKRDRGAFEAGIQEFTWKVWGTREVGLRVVDNRTRNLIANFCTTIVGSWMQENKEVITYFWRGFVILLNYK
jgi:hypothetical protein